MTATAHKPKPIPSPKASLVDMTVEVRHEMSPRILDKRGQVAEDLQLRLGLDEFAIGHEGIEVRAKSGRERVFLTVANAGYFSRESTSADEVGARAAHAFREMCDMRIYKSPNHIALRRLGVRGRFLISSNLTFSELCDQVQKVLGPPSSNLVAALGGKIVDVGYTYDFEDPDGKFRIQTGPMRDDQVVNMFDRPEDTAIPGVGLFVDVDFYKEVSGNVQSTQVESYINRFTHAVWSKKDVVAAFILAK